MGRQQNTKRWRREQQYAAQLANMAHRLEIAKNKRGIVESVPLLWITLAACVRQHSGAVRGSIALTILIAASAPLTTTHQPLTLLSHLLTACCALITLWFTLVMTKPQLRQRFRLTNDDNIAELSFRSLVWLAGLTLIISIA